MVTWKKSRRNLEEIADCVTNQVSSAMLNSLSTLCSTYYNVFFNSGKIPLRSQTLVDGIITFHFKPLSITKSSND